MESNHNSEQINAFRETLKYMVEMCSALAVAMEAIKITWDDTQKVTQEVEEMYNSNIFDKLQLMEWENKDDSNNTWTDCRQFFKERYQTKKQFGRTHPTGFESAANLNEVHEKEMKIM